MPSAPLKAFILYAHEDKDVRDKLLRHLRVQVVRGDLELWSDHEIKPGDVWDEAIRARLEQSELLLLLVSDDFFNSDYIQNVELREAARRHAAGECRLLPIIARDCDWQDHPFLGRIQALPPGGKPVKSKGWDSEDEPYRAIVDGVKTAVRQLRPGGAPAPPIPRPEAPRRPLPRRTLLLSGALLLAALLGWLAWKWQNPVPPAGVETNPAQGAQRTDSLNRQAAHPDTAAKQKTPPTASTSREKTQKEPEFRNPEPANPKPETQPAPVFDRSYETSEGMTRGKKGRLFGFRNAATGQVLGWYDDAADFSGGRAYVKQNGRYFYIDKTGHCVENCE